jgi:hypothetical protein
MADTIYMPATDNRPVEPAPYLLTPEEVGRLCRLTCKDVEESLWRYRDKGLKAVQIGKRVLYRLPDVLAFIEARQQENPR